MSLTLELLVRIGFFYTTLEVSIILQTQNQKIHQCSQYYSPHHSSWTFQGSPEFFPQHISTTLALTTSYYNISQGIKKIPPRKSKRTTEFRNSFRLTCAPSRFVFNCRGKKQRLLYMALKLSVRRRHSA